MTIDMEYEYWYTVDVYGKWYDLCGNDQFWPQIAIRP